MVRLLGMKKVLCLVVNALTVDVWGSGTEILQLDLNRTEKTLLFSVFLYLC